jgi:hypothetical protein
MGFVNGRKAMDNIFIIKTTIDKYLRLKIERIYCCFLIYRKLLIPLIEKSCGSRWDEKGTTDKFEVLRICIVVLNFV